MKNLDCHVSPRSALQVCVVVTVFLAIQLFAHSATAQITIDEGPMYVPLGAGTESYSDPFTPGKATGATVFQTGYDLSRTDNLWFGLRVDAWQIGYAQGDITPAPGPSQMAGYGRERYAQGTLAPGVVDAYPQPVSPRETGFGSLEFRV